MTAPMPTPQSVALEDVLVFLYQNGLKAPVAMTRLHLQVMGEVYAAEEIRAMVAEFQRIKSKGEIK